MLPADYFFADIDYLQHVYSESSRKYSALIEVSSVNRATGLENSEAHVDPSRTQNKGTTMMWRTVYIAMGILVARWVFRRNEPIDRIAKLREIGGL